MSMWKPLLIEHDGHVWTGAWQLAIGMVNVSSTYGSCSGPVVGQPEHTAEDLLFELVEDWRGRAAPRKPTLS